MPNDSLLHISLIILFFSLLLSLFHSLCWAIWHVSTDHDEFFYTPKVNGITYRKRRTAPPPKHPLSHLPHSLLIIDMQLSDEKPARLSVDLFDEYFSWQTGHLTLCTKAMWSLILPICTYAYTCTICSYMLLLLFCSECFTYCLFTFIFHWTVYLPPFVLLFWLTYRQ